MDVSVMLTDINAHGFSSVDPIQQLRLLNDTYQEVCNREPWPFLETLVSLTFDGISATPGNFPSNFGSLLSIATGTTPSTPLSNIRLDDYRENVDAYNNAPPARYYIFRGSSMFVLGIPGATDTVNMEYVKVPTDLLSTDLSATLLLPARYHRVLVIGTLAKLYWQRDRGKQAQAYDVMFEHRMQTMRDDLWSQQFQSPEYIHRVDNDDYHDDWGWGW